MKRIIFFTIGLFFILYTIGLLFIEKNIKESLKSLVFGILFILAGIIEKWGADNP